VELQNSGAPGQTIAMKQVGKQTQLAHHGRDSFVNDEPAVATKVVNYLLKSMKKC
jgi:hypothetical protein